MLRNTKDLEGYTIGATDGEIGHVKDFYFDERSWVIRYLIVDTGNWLVSRKVLISPIAVGTPNWTQELLPVSITREQVRHSPDIDTDKPVTRQQEREYSGQLLGQRSISHLMLLGEEGLAVRQALQTDVENARAEAAHEPNGDPHLRSCHAAMRDHVHASDGDIGHVQGMLLDEQPWVVRSLIVDTSNWWLGHQVLIPTQSVKKFSWADGSVSVDLTR
ncbi:MAG: PRC-barrel domain-containing protein, partial [Rhodoferax sp.]